MPAGNVWCPSTSFSHPSRGFSCSSEPFFCLIHGFFKPGKDFIHPSWGFICPSLSFTHSSEGFSCLVGGDCCPSQGFILPSEGFICQSPSQNFLHPSEVKGCLCPAGGVCCPSQGFICPRRILILNWGILALSAAILLPRQWLCPSKPKKNSQVGDFSKLRFCPLNQRLYPSSGLQLVLVALSDGLPQEHSSTPEIHCTTNWKTQAHPSSHSFIFSHCRYWTFRHYSMANTFPNRTNKTFWRPQPDITTWGGLLHWIFFFPYTGSSIWTQL